MARTRSIKPGFFLNDLLGECQPLARLLFAGLWCHADRNGVVEYRPRRLKAEILPFDDADVAVLVSELEERGFVVRFKSGGSEWIYVKKFREHQTPHPREPAVVTAGPEEDHDGSLGSFSGNLGRPEIFTAGTRQARASANIGQDITGRAPESAETSPGERQDKPGRAPRQAGFPTPSSSSTSLLPSPLPSSVARPADAGSPQQVVWATQTGWQGITPADRNEWRLAFPAVDIDAELASSGLWLKANPHKAKRTNWRKFIVGWLKNAQDRGGTRKASGSSRGDPPPARAWTGDDAERFEATKRAIVEKLKLEAG